MIKNMAIGTFKPDIESLQTRSLLVQRKYNPLLGMHGNPASPLLRAERINAHQLKQLEPAGQHDRIGGWVEQVGMTADLRILIRVKRRHLPHRQGPDVLGLQPVLNRKIPSQLGIIHGFFGLKPAELRSGVDHDNHKKDKAIEGRPDDLEAGSRIDTVDDIVQCRFKRSVVGHLISSSSAYEG